MRATYLGAIKGSSLRRAAVTQQVTKTTIPAERGTITDRNGVQLAISQAADDVAANPRLIKDPLSASQRLAPPLNKPQPTVLAALSRKHNGVVYTPHLLPVDK